MSIDTMDTLEKKERRFLPKDFKIIDWDTVEPFTKKLLEREIESLNELEQWLEDKSELESVLSEDMAWRYINMTRDTKSEQHKEAFNDFVTNIQPHLAPISNALDKKLHASPLRLKLKMVGKDVLLRDVEKDIEIFREENVPLQVKLAQETQKYGQIVGDMTITHEGKEITMQQAGKLLQSTDRKLREEIYRRVAQRRLDDSDKLQELLTTLIKLRDRVARNAGFDNYRDYKFREMGRFDYSKDDCFRFHSSVESAVVPMLNELAERKKKNLKLERLRPWDAGVDSFGAEPLKPFETAEELTKTTIEVFKRLDPWLGERLEIMREMGHLDLESRVGKAPGGYNYPLDEVGVPFIFMNATGTMRDMVTLLHEGGHAVHSFLMRDLPLSHFKHPPSEVAELASMSMELLTMDHWDLFFKDEKSLKRAKYQHLEQIIETLPWVATIDKFQHWLYEHPKHKIEQRTTEWNNIFDTFSENVTDWKGLENFKDILWQKQLHIYEVPFYYIEYGMAQLGAVAIWKNFKENPDLGLENYREALSLGYTEGIAQVYKKAGIHFDFSEKYISELMGFVREEMEKNI